MFTSIQRRLDKQSCESHAAYVVAHCAARNGETSTQWEMSNFDPLPQNRNL